MDTHTRLKPFIPPQWMNQYLLYFRWCQNAVLLLKWNFSLRDLSSFTKKGI